MEKIKLTWRDVAWFGIGFIFCFTVIMIWLYNDINAIFYNLRIENLHFSLNETKIVEEVARMAQEI